jgi:hypothetical protein
MEPLIIFVIGCAVLFVVYAIVFRSKCACADELDELEEESNKKSNTDN